MGPNDDLVTETLALQAAVAGLGDKIGISDALTREARKQRFRTVVLTVGLALDIILSVTVGVLYAQQETTTTRVEKNATTLHAVQCSLYSLFLGAYDPSSESALKDLAKYERQFAQIRHDYTQLGCRPSLPSR